MPFGTNFTSTTRELWDRTVYKQAWMKMILFALIMERGQVLPCGKSIKHTVDYEEMDDLFQEYTSNEPLTGGKTTMLETAEWYRKYAQLPVEISGEEWDAQSGAGGANSGRVIPFKQWLVAKGHRAMKLGMNTILYRAGSSTRDSQTTVGVQGIQDAILHDITYGGLARADTTTRKWWQGASLALDFADAATAMSPIVRNFRKCIDAISHHLEEGPADAVCITSTTVFRHLQAELEGQALYKPAGKHAKFGFITFELDGIEVFAEPYFTNIRNANKATMAKYMFFLNMRHWTLHLSPKRKLGRLTEFVWQGEQQNGKDEYLARILFGGNLICTQPNANIFKSNVAFG